MLKKIKQNIPNIITISRILSSITASLLFITNSLQLSIIFYIYGAISDCLDGIAARRLKAFTELGRKLDPLSDKIFALSLLLPSIVLGNYLMIIPFILEGEIASISLTSTKLNKKSQTERIGKYKTVSLFPTLILGLISTKVPGCYLLLSPMLLVSTNLQVKTIKAYNKQLKNNLNNKITNNDITNNQNNSSIQLVSNKTSKQKIIQELEKIKEEIISFSLPDNYDIKRKEKKYDRY